MKPYKDFSDGTYPCSVCGVRKDLGEFPPNKGSRSGRHPRCRDCKKEYQNAYQKTEPYLRKRRVYEWKNHGIIDFDHDDYDKYWDAQDGECAICGTTENVMGKAFAVDHDHETGQARGLLCNPCNIGLGCFKDDPQRLSDALEYLFSRHEFRMTV